MQSTLESLRVRQGDFRGRIEILEELEQSFAGLGTGVRSVLERVNEERTRATGHFDSTEAAATYSLVAGLVADLLTVPHEVARYVELALGETAQRFVVRSPQALDALAAAVGEVPGRVGFIPYREPDEAAVTSASSRRSLADHVNCELPGLPRQLLSNVYLVETLAEGRALQSLHPGSRIVTRAGELLEIDGTLSIGPLKVEAGLVSRKSELRELREQYRSLSSQVAATESELTDLRRQTEESDGVIQTLDAEIAILSGTAGNLLQQIARQRQQVEQLDELVELLQQETGTLEREVQRAEFGLGDRQVSGGGSGTGLGAREGEAGGIADGAARGRRSPRPGAAGQHDRTGRVQPRLARARSDEGTREPTRSRAAETARGSGRPGGGRTVDPLEAGGEYSGHARASAGQADAYREKEHRERLVLDLSAKAAADRTVRERVRDELQALRTGWQEKQNLAHARELAVHDLAARREGIVSRLRDDYGVDLGTLVPEGDHTGDENRPLRGGNRRRRCFGRTNVFTH